VEWKTLELVGVDGPFVSVLSETSEGIRTCGTLNLESGQAATLDEYDPKQARRRTRRAARLLASRPQPPGFDPDQFLVGTGHVRFCWIDATGVRHDLDVP
jgi:hypothetical protein